MPGSVKVQSYTRKYKWQLSAICNKTAVSFLFTTNYSVADTCCRCVADAVSATHPFAL
jgi:hypothetical protein